MSNDIVWVLDAELATDAPFVEEFDRESTNGEEKKEHLDENPLREFKIELCFCVCLCEFHSFRPPFCIARFAWFGFMNPVLIPENALPISPLFCPELAVDGNAVEGRGMNLCCASGGVEELIGLL